LDIDVVIHAFDQTYRERGKQQKILVIADITYNSHIPIILERLTRDGWENVLAPDVIHDPSALVPNREINIQEEELKTYSLFHISDPPPALLLTLNSRVKDLHIHPTSSTSALQTNTSITLRRRYALLTSLSTNPIFGILINTLSVRNYLETVTTIKKMIEKAGKKSYTFVVGKVNAAKIANFSEIGGWVVVGCWESSLIESTEFYRPIITPFELQLTLMGDEERVWTGEWRGDFGSIDAIAIEKTTPGKKGLEEVNGENNLEIGQDDDSEEESAPPEFDLRTGRYVSHSRPMRTTISASNPTPKSLGEPKNETVSQALTLKAKGDLATVNGAVSPGAEYLRTQRTWTGLGSDFSTGDASTSIEEGRGGIARGYRVGDEEKT
jgi:diphthamide biosynthesis protein 2